MKQRKPQASRAPRSEPRTGVGTPDHAEAAGAELGGDTGDVEKPLNDLRGGSYGASGMHEASSVVTPGKGKGVEREKPRAA